MPAGCLTNLSAGDLLWTHRLGESTDFISRTYKTTFQLSQHGLLYGQHRNRVIIVTESGVVDLEYTELLDQRHKHEQLGGGWLGPIWLDECVGLIGQNDIHVITPPYTKVDRHIPITNPVAVLGFHNDIAVPREPMNMGTRFNSGPLSVGFGYHGACEFASLVIAPDRRSATWHGVDADGKPPESLGFRTGGVGQSVITSFSLNAQPIRYVDTWARVAHVGKPFSDLHVLEHPKHQRLHCFLTDDLVLTFSRGFFERKRARPQPAIIDLRTRTEIKPKLPKPHQYHQIVGIAPERLFLTGEADDGGNEVVCYHLDTSGLIDVPTGAATPPIAFGGAIGFSGASGATGERAIERPKASDETPPQASQPRLLDWFSGILRKKR